MSRVTPSREYPRRHEGRCRPGVDQRRACRHKRESKAGSGLRWWTPGFRWCTRAASMPAPAREATRIASGARRSPARRKPRRSSPGTSSRATKTASSPTTPSGQSRRPDSTSTTQRSSCGRRRPQSTSSTPRSSTTRTISAGRSCGSVPTRSTASASTPTATSATLTTPGSERHPWYWPPGPTSLSDTRSPYQARNIAAGRVNRGLDPDSAGADRVRGWPILRGSVLGDGRDARMALILEVVPLALHRAGPPEVDLR